MKLSPGKNTAIIELPIDKLHSGTYTVSLGAAIKNTKWIIKPSDFTVNITIAVKNPLPKSLFMKISNN